MIFIDPGQVWASATIPALSDFQAALGDQVTRREISRDIAYAVKHLCGGIEFHWADGAFDFILPVGSNLRPDYRPSKVEY